MNNLFSERNKSMAIEKPEQALIGQKTA